MHVLTPSATDQRAAATLVGHVSVGFAALASLLGLAAARDAVLLLPLSATLLALAGLTGTALVAAARARVEAHESRPASIGFAARRPQATLIPLLAATAAMCAWLAGRAAPAAWPPWILVAGAVVAFALLLAERSIAVLSSVALPEATSLARLLRLPIGVVLVTMVIRVAGQAPAIVAALQVVVATLLVLVSAELAVRAAGRWFLPPPDPASARAATSSVLLQIASGTREGLVAPLRRHAGLDLSRSWALAYVRAALVPLLLVLLLGGWGLTALVVVPGDGRAVAEHFGAPVGILPPGLHLVPPWPLGRAVPVEFGTIHETTLSGLDVAAEHVPADAPAPAGADRLWEQAHPGEQFFLVAGYSGAQQSFEIVSADVRVLYRVGMSDAAALRAVTQTGDPAPLVRGAAGRAMASVLAHTTLADILGQDHAALTRALRQAAQADLDALGTGLELVALVVEAIHPPPGAADAYHAVQAAEIKAGTAVASARGSAQGALAAARQQAETLHAQSEGMAADVTGAARAALTGFTADRAASAAGGRAFLLERYFRNIVAALSGTPKTILDHRLGNADSPVTIDLRPLLPAAPATRDD